MKFANPAPLGLAGFALTTWMLSMVNAGWYDAGSVPLVLASAFAFGGTAQFFAGISGVPARQHLRLRRLLRLWRLLVVLRPVRAILRRQGPRPTSSVGGCSCGVSSPSYMWLGTFRANRVLQLIFLVLWITFVALAARRLDRKRRAA